ncbi:hypothetical protein E5288_WYG007581 [Bos mutus]|uniref:Immunoglobulin domain-containing protein n=1 Tax=Bos mutus TaxID=72004 RepID=A0A6B0RI52_9CETA|nr:hypothetical protein [Bos mutus]
MESTANGAPVATTALVSFEEAPAAHSLHHTQFTALLHRSQWEQPPRRRVKGVFQLDLLRSAVRGVERGSLTVRCRYDPGYEHYVKWWCRGAAWENCPFVIKTTGSEKEVKKGRVSIRDNWKDRSFTVTMEELRLDDSDTYWCGIEIPGPDLGNPVEVTIDPAPTVLISTLATSNANMFTAPVAPKENQGQLPLLGSVHFLLLVFLKPLAFLVLRPPTQEKLQEGMEERMPSSGPSSLEDIYDLKSVSHTT